MSSVTDLLQSLERENRLRLIPKEPRGAVVDLSSNDYLSLATRQNEFMEEFHDRFPDAGFTSAASRLLSTRQKYHEALEDTLESLYSRPALLFNSGYHANVGCVGALSLPSTLFVCDKLIHASVIDGLRISGAVFKRFPHNEISALRRVLEKESDAYERIVVVVESIYSMDGDEAPLQELIALKEDFPGMMLYVDEAHAFGVRGSRGLGIAEELRIVNDIDILVGTFGKAAASAGAFASCNAELKSLLINTARPFIFSTALPPVNAAWTLLMIEKICGMKKERETLRSTSRQFASALEYISGVATGSTSQIIPLRTGDAENALRLAGILREAGFLALPIRRPTVPPGGERIRFSLGADMTMDDLQPAVDILREEYIR